ncbi:hypothetical protein GGF31_002727 [Allomyces arbusculus]|nr:hypothetical protein GGF31_002727 [Allomyces arbusculus]
MPPYVDPARPPATPIRPSGGATLPDLPPLMSLSPTRATPMPSASTFKAPAPTRAIRLPAAPAINAKVDANAPTAVDAPLALLANAAQTNQAHTKALYNGAIAAVSVLMRLFLAAGVFPTILARTIAPLNVFVGWVFGSLAVFNLAESFYTQFIKPLHWNQVRDTVSQLNPRQRELLGVDKDVARLVDAVTPRRPSAAPAAKRAIAPRQPAPSTVPRSVKRIVLQPTPSAPPTPSCVARTPDVRYASQNALLRATTGDETAAAPTAASTATAGPRLPLNLPIKPIFQTYQLSSAPTAEEQVVADPKKIKHINAFDTLARFQVDEEQLAAWVENMREWLATKVFKPLVEDIKKVDEFLETRGWSHLAVKNAVPSVDELPAAPAAPAAPAVTSLFGTPAAAPTAPVTGFGGGGLFGRPIGSFGSGSLAATIKPAEPAKPPTSLNGLAQALPSEPLARTRILLERYLYLPTYPATVRAYVLHRIAALAAGSSLAAYRWDAGGVPPSASRTAQWTPAYPSDAELVMHVFATWIDLQMPGAAKGGAMYAPFTAKYVRNMEAEEKTELPDVWHIQKVEKTPPYFRLGHGHDAYAVFPKRNNAFATLCLFALKVKEEYAGYLDMLDIGGNVVGLTSVLTDDE